ASAKPNSANEMMMRLRSRRRYWVRVTAKVRTYLKTWRAKTVRARTCRVHEVAHGVSRGRCSRIPHRRRLKDAERSSFGIVLPGVEPISKRGERRQFARGRSAGTGVYVQST